MKIITIGRECGSGGHTIARRVAEMLDIPCYDRELITLAAEKCQISEEYAHNLEKSVKSTLAGFSYNEQFIPYEIPSLNDQINSVQVDIIKELAKEGPCVIVGRGADYVLKDRDDVLKVFITAQMDYKLAASARRHDLKDKEAMNILKRRDKDRSKHYYYYTGQEWGAKENYDLIIDASKFDVEGSAQIICAAYKSK